MSNRTFAIIKPDAVKNGYTGKIYDRIISAEFKCRKNNLKFRLAVYPQSKT